MYLDTTARTAKNGATSSSFSSCDNLLSLLGRLDLEVSLPAFSHIRTPVSFHDPFEDQSLEPSPIRPGYSMLHDQQPSLHGDAPVRDSSNYQEGLLNILDSALDIVDGSKREIEQLFADQQAHVPSPPKRRRLNSQEMTGRFRPNQEKQWRAQCQKLIQYKMEFGHCCVPHSYSEDPTLARWVKRQRYQYKKFNDGDPTSTMCGRRIQELESIGFVWHSHTAAWLEKFNELKEFKQRTGHCNVPSNYPQNMPLSTWVKCQRRQYKLCVTGGSSCMTKERYQALHSLGFAFEGRQTTSTIDLF